MERPDELPAVAFEPEPLGWLHGNALEAFLEETRTERLAKDRRDCYWLYVVTNCKVGQASRPSATTARMAVPQLQEPIKDPARFPWHEVTKVAHYWLEVDAMTKPMMVREEQFPFGREKP